MANKTKDITYISAQQFFDENYADQGYNMYI